MKRLFLILALTTAMPAHAGGPVLIEDATETVQPRDRNALPLIIIGALIVGGLLAGGSDACQGPDDTPAPPKGGC